MVDIIGTKVVDIRKGGMKGMQLCGVTRESCSLGRQKCWRTVNGAEQGYTSPALI